MKIRKLQLKNIGVFDDETIEFQSCPAKDKAEIHIFTGQNGSGKSTILMALASAYDYLENNKGSYSYRDSKPLSNNFHKRFVFSENSLPYFEVTKEITATDSTITRNEKTFGDEVTQLAHKHNKNDFYESYVSSKELITSANFGGFSYAVFALSGYRQINSEKIEAIKEPEKFNPLYQSLEFIKNYNQLNQLTINQLIANNISKSAIEKGRNEEKSKKFANVIKSVEQAISEITDWKVEFDLETEPTNLLTKINGKELDFDVLPDGLRSLISWIADLLGRVDLLKWRDDLPIFEKNLILLLDEIEVHLHPEWQRKVLPVVQKLFKNAQIFVSTHSPFVVNSVDDAWVYKLELENGKAKVAEPIRTENSNSITQVLREIFDVYGLFGDEVQDNIDELEKLRNKILSNGSSEKDENDFLKIAKILYDEPSDQVKNIVKGELQQLSEIKGKKFSI